MLHFFLTAKDWHSQRLTNAALLWRLSRWECLIKLVKMSGNLWFLQKCTRHADAGVVSNAIQTCAIIMAGVRSTLVEILFTARPSITPDTVTGEGAISVHALATMLARVGPWWWRGKTLAWKQNRSEAWQRYMLCLELLTNAAFVSVDIAGVAYISRWTVTVEHATDGVGVTLRALSTGVTDTGVISMAEQTWKEHHVDKRWAKYLWIKDPNAKHTDCISATGERFNKARLNANLFCGRINVLDCLTWITFSGFSLKKKRWWI